MNKKIVLSVLSLFLLATFSILAQDPISWNFSLEDAGNGEVDIVAKATVDQGCICMILIYLKGDQTPQ